VASVDIAANTITIRDTPVYYSGLLTTGSYYDDAQGNSAGNTITYPGSDDCSNSACAPVVRLTNFSIYVFRDIQHPKLTDEYGYPQTIRQMIRISDTYGQADPLADDSGAEFSVISENIWDMQISYKAFVDFKSADRHTSIDPTHLYFTEGSAYLEDPYTGFNALMDDIRGKRLKQLDITIIAIADELGGQGEGSNAGNIPQIGDNSYINLPSRKISFRLFSFSVEPRNFGIFFN
jgi:hypothetical protein